MFFIPKLVTREDDETRRGVVVALGNNTELTSVVIHNGVHGDHMKMSLSRLGQPIDKGLWKSINDRRGGSGVLMLMRST